MQPAAGILGITPHSGWAAAVLLTGTPQEPRVILRERLELSEARLARAQTAGVELHGAGILDSSGRSGATLAAILASHALIHTADGNHFRAALAQACQALGLRVARIPQRELPARATAALRESPQQLAATLKALGRGMGSPWGADQKDATLLAWLLLAEVALFRRE